MITKTAIATITVMLTLAVGALPATAEEDDKCRKNADLHGETVEAVNCKEDGSSGSGLPSETKQERWVRLCGRTGIQGYASDDDDLNVSVVEVGEASGVVSEAIYTEYGRSVGALEVVKLGDFTVPTAGTFNVYSVKCAAGDASANVTRVFAEGTEVSPIEIRDRVVASLRIPEPSLAGAPSLVDSYSIVKIPTWFWIEDWAQDGLTDAQNLAGLSVSVTATPVMSTWNPGDGSLPINCPNGGTAWQDGMKENETVCSHTYTKSTAGLPDDALTLEASITWDLTWSVNNTPQGTFDTYTNTTTMSHQVGEIQAVLIKNEEPTAD